MIGGDSFNEELPGADEMVYPVMQPKTEFDEIDENAERIRNALRKLDVLDPDVTAAGEALGFFIYKARKETT